MSAGLLLLLWLWLYDRVRDSRPADDAPRAPKDGDADDDVIDDDDDNDIDKAPPCPCPCMFKLLGTEGHGLPWNPILSAHIPIAICALSAQEMILRLVV